jgi:hypothetical protein
LQALVELALERLGFVEIILDGHYRESGIGNGESDAGARRDAGCERRQQ